MFVYTCTCRNVSDLCSYDVMDSIADEHLHVVPL